MQPAPPVGAPRAPHTKRLLFQALRALASVERLYAAGALPRDDYLRAARAELVAVDRLLAALPGVSLRSFYTELSLPKDEAYRRADAGLDELRAEHRRNAAAVIAATEGLLLLRGLRATRTANPAQWRHALWRTVATLPRAAGAAGVDLPPHAVGDLQEALQRVRALPADAPVAAADADALGDAAEQLIALFRGGAADSQTAP